jgi:hypothetical protein
MRKIGNKLEIRFNTRPIEEVKLKLANFKDVTLKEGMEKLGEYDKNYCFC